MEIWDCTFPTLNEAALRDTCTLVEISCVMHLFMEKLMGAADPKRCWWSMALYWFGDQEYKGEGSRLRGAPGVNKTWVATAEIAETSVDLDHGQDTL